MRHVPHGPIVIVHLCAGHETTLAHGATGPSFLNNMTLTSTIDMKTASIESRQHLMMYAIYCVASVPGLLSQRLSHRQQGTAGRQGAVAGRAIWAAPCAG